MPLSTRMPKPLHTRQYALFLQELRAVRERAGVTQTELASRLGEHQTVISKSELGVRRLDVIETVRWTHALGVDFVRFSRDLQALLERNGLLGS